MHAVLGTDRVGTDDIAVTVELSSPIPSHSPSLLVLMSFPISLVFTRQANDAEQSQRPTWLCKASVGWCMTAVGLHRQGLSYFDDGWSHVPAPIQSNQDLSKAQPTAVRHLALRVVHTDLAVG